MQISELCVNDKRKFTKDQIDFISDVRDIVKKCYEKVYFCEVVRIGEKNGEDLECIAIPKKKFFELFPDFKSSPNSKIAVRLARMFCMMIKISIGKKPLKGCVIGIDTGISCNVDGGEIEYFVEVKI